MLASGETHALDEVSSALLHTLTDHPGEAATSDVWLDRLLQSTQEGGVPPTVEERQTCEAALELLQRIGVIEVLAP